ncbi:DAK2 domain-containing protein [Dysosmobacter sp.]|uniref:DAK2 domain-containing protein n=1 Tax=Dysosmobacter sp. TaxID=2591382 RepID=UPI001BB470B8|nr:DAK2 domain-containing protein [Dysosmobacter sp. Marseille-Q4140]
MNELITGALFKQMVLHGAAAITAQKQAINDLNVFPVPDGDTGTNMSMTIGAAVTELRKSSPSSVDQAASITASALLRGARGNSGVILSLLFRGLSKSLKGRESADAASFAAAMQEGVSSAYKAVMKPAEGTVLTVSRLAAKRAVDVAAEEKDVEKVLEEAIREGYDALAQTVEMNPVLKKAGVVDAGGKGYLLILEGMLSELRGEPMPEQTEESEETKEKADFAYMAAEEITFAFDTVFIVRKASPDISLEPLRTYLNSIGDSLVIGEDDESFKVHVHTNIPGSALTESQKYGTLELAKIENMRTQAEALAQGREAQSTDDLEAVEAELEAGEGCAPAAPAEPEKPYGFLAVCAGDGLAAVFQDLGADGVVSGGQTMNPSTESILEGVEKIPAETVFILPNNSNIIMAAQQCAALTEKNVVVIPTKTVPQGITAMMNVDFEAPDAESITQAMTEALATVTTAQITYAARNSDFDGFDIKEGDYLALEEGRLFGTDSDLNALLERLAAEAVEKGASFISLYFGEDVSEDDAQAAGKLFEERCPQAEVAVLSGGQPVYYYIISME